jgi:hypothetical protein
VKQSPKISIFTYFVVVSNEKNLNLNLFFKSIVNRTYNLSDVEVVMGLKGQDKYLTRARRIILKYQRKINIKPVELSEEKYSERKNMLNILLDFANPASEVYWPLPEGVELCFDFWDRVCTNVAKREKNGFFILNRTFSYDSKIEPISSTIKSPESFPILSKNLVDISGGFGDLKNISTWFSYIECQLQSKYSVKMNFKLKEPFAVFGKYYADLQDPSDTIDKNLAKLDNIAKNIYEAIERKKKKSAFPKRREKILSILMASNSQFRLSKFFDMLEETAQNPKRFEVLIQVDKEQHKIVDYIKKEKIKRSFDIVCVEIDNKHGYFGLNKGYNILLEHTSVDTYYVAIFSDSMHFYTKGWDNDLFQYVDAYSYNLFFLKISKHKNHHYEDLFHAWEYCENWGIYTKEWVKVLGGWGDFWCPDGTQEMIHHAMMKYTDYQIKRYFPIQNIEVGRALREPGYPIQDLVMGSKKLISGEMYLFYRLVSPSGLDKLKRLALRLRLSIYLNEERDDLNPKDFDLVEDITKKTVKQVHRKTGNVLIEKSYKIPFLTKLYYLYWRSFRKRKIFCLYIYRKFIKSDQITKFIVEKIIKKNKNILLQIILSSEVKRSLDNRFFDSK